MVMAMLPCPILHVKLPIFRERDGFCASLDKCGERFWEEWLDNTATVYTTETIWQYVWCYWSHARSPRPMITAVVAERRHFGIYQKVKNIPWWKAYTRTVFTGVHREKARIRGHEVQNCLRNRQKCCHYLNVHMCSGVNRQSLWGHSVSTLSDGPGTPSHRTFLAHYHALKPSFVRILTI